MVGHHDPDLAQRARRDDLPDARHVRQVARPHRLHGEQSALGRDGLDCGRLGGVEREGLLDEHVLAVLECEDRLLGVERVRCRDVDDVDVGVGDQGLVRAVHAGDIEVGGERGGGVGAARADGGEVEPGDAQV
nr:hypothetical protein GCM10025699_34360 [Microbacterium flavescens]